jgi:hypothetical protein
MLEWQCREVIPVVGLEIVIANPFRANQDGRKRQRPRQPCVCRNGAKRSKKGPIALPLTARDIKTLSGNRLAGNLEI